MYVGLYGVGVFIEVCVGGCVCVGVYGVGV